MNLYHRQQRFAMAHAFLITQLALIGALLCLAGCTDLAETKEAANRGNKVETNVQDDIDTHNEKGEIELREENLTGDGDLETAEYKHLFWLWPEAWGDWRANAGYPGAPTPVNYGGWWWGSRGEAEGGPVQDSYPDPY